MTHRLLSRRRALGLLTLAGALTLGSAGGLRLLRGVAPHVPGLRALDANGYRTLRALARVHLPAGAVFDVGGDDEGIDLARAIDGYIADLGREEADELLAAIGLLELGPLLFEARPVTFPNLSPSDQEAHWRSWVESKLAIRRQIALGLRKLLSFLFFDHPRVWPHIGYSGPSYVKVKP